MPYKSEAQRKFFHANKGKLEAQGVDVGEWDKATKGKKLPEKVATAMFKNASATLAALLLHNALTKVGEGLDLSNYPVSDLEPGRREREMDRLGIEGAAQKGERMAYDARVAPQIAAGQEPAPFGRTETPAEGQLRANRNLHAIPPVAAPAVNPDADIQSYWAAHPEAVSQFSNKLHATLNPAPVMAKPTTPGAPSALAVNNVASSGHPVANAQPRF